jgi:hypothetical protein
VSQHLVKFVDDPLSPTPTELSFVFARSFEDAMDKASAAVGPLRAQHGMSAGYIIEDFSGRRVMIGPGKDCDA